MYVAEYQRRQKYRINIGNKLTRAKTRELFDTEKVKPFYLAKYDKPHSAVLTPEEEKRAREKYEKRTGADAQKGYKSAYRDFSKPSFNDDKRKFEDLTQKWYSKSLIWVCIDEPDEGPTFYSHIGRANYFHHTSFNAAERVLGAGEWIVKDGVLLEISANSGHYQPTVNYLYDCLLRLAEACHEETAVLAWDTDFKDWDSVSHLDFKENLSHYTAHPRSGVKGSKDAGGEASAGYVST
jgi:hypothetical protein